MFFRRYSAAWYIEILKRLLAILMLLVLGFPAAASLLALNLTAESRLPSCCRRNGAHHCNAPDMLGEALSGTTLKAATSSCDQYPATLPTAALTDAFLVSQVGFAIGLVRDSGCVATKNLGPPSKALRSSQTRGPPVAPATTL